MRSRGGTLAGTTITCAGWTGARAGVQLLEFADRSEGVGGVGEGFGLSPLNMIVC